MSLRLNNQYLFRTIVLTLLLAACGVAGNHFSVPLFFSVSFIFGSVAAFIALITLGLVPALVVSAIASSYTLYIWGHPYAAVIFTFEILFVGLLRKRIPVLAYADFFYWVLIGAPLCWLFYSFILDLGPNSVALIALKQPLNGIFNAVVAQLLFSLGSRFWPYAKDKRKLISAKQLVPSSLILMTILTGGIPILFNNYRIQSLQEENLIKLMTSHGTAIIEEISVVRKLFTADEVEQIYKAEHYARRRLKLTDPGLSITYAEPARRVQIGWIRQYSGVGDSSHVLKNLNIWKPDGDMPEMVRWERSEYYMTLSPRPDLNISEILVTHPAKPVVQALSEMRTQTLIALAILLSAGLLISHLLSRMLISPIQRLALASSSTRNITSSDKIHQFPRSSIQEFDDLADALQHSEDEVLANVTKLEEMRDNLEERVKDRTVELARLSTVASQTLNGVVITDLRGITEWVNEGFLKMTGYSAEEFIGKTPGEILQGTGTSKTTINRISEAVKERRAFHEEILNYSKSGDEIWLEISCNPMTDHNGNISGFIAIETDVTERRYNQLNLVKARIDADRANHAKSQFLSTMSHEIRTPLNGIMGMSQLLFDTKLTKAQRTHLETILNSGNTLLSIINDVLDMSKIEAGALELEETAFDLQELISSTLTPFRTLSSEKGLELKLTHIPDIKSLIISDPVRIRQIVWNLVSNAIKFTSKGAVTVSIDLTELPSSAQQKYDSQIELKVQDTGDGISEDRLTDIFEPFTQEDNTITRKFGGTGLGLSIVKQLIELMSGTISVKSTIGKGTTFTVTIPFNYATEQAASDTRKKQENNKNSYKPGLRVLVAEDNFVNATIAQTFLEKLSCQVTVVENGKLAIDEVQNNLPDIVFMDIHMPVLDGIAATEEIRKLKSNKELPIVGLTADAFTESKVKFQKAGMDTVLTKPFTEDQIQAVLATFCPKNS